MPRCSLSVLLLLAALARAGAQPAAPVDLLGGQVINRTATPLSEGDRAGIQLDERPGQGLVWVQDVEFATGTIEVEVRGRDVFQRSFVGIAFHGVSDERYEVVYLRPFNFRADDLTRRSHAIQYAVHPDFTWPKLRAEYPGEFEAGVPGDPNPEGWVRLRVEVRADRVRAYIGDAKAPALDVRRLGTLRSGRVGVWTGEGSGGDFANFRLHTRDPLASGNI